VIVRSRVDIVAVVLAILVKDAFFTVATGDYSATLAGFVSIAG